MFYEPIKDNHGLARPPFKSCVAPRPIGWLSTMSADGIPNLAPFSQFTNLTFDPPYVLVAINQNEQGLRKDTTVNIEATGEFVYNMATYDLREQLNLTAASFPPEVDEFEEAGLAKADSILVKLYRVAESPIQFECEYVQTVRLPGNGLVGTSDLIIGRVVGVHIKDEVIMADGKIDMEKIRPLARMGYSDYTVVESVFEMRLSDITGDAQTLTQGLEGKFGAFTK